MLAGRRSAPVWSDTQTNYMSNKHVMSQQRHRHDVVEMALTGLIKTNCTQKKIVIPDCLSILFGC